MSCPGKKWANSKDFIRLLELKEYRKKLLNKSLADFFVAGVCFYLVPGAKCQSARSPGKVPVGSRFSSFFVEFTHADDILENLFMGSKRRGVLSLSLSLADDANKSEECGVHSKGWWVRITLQIKRVARISLLAARCAQLLMDFHCFIAVCVCVHKVGSGVVSFISQPPRRNAIFPLENPRRLHCAPQMVLLAKSDAQDPSAPAANVICVKNAFGPSTFPSFRESGARPSNSQTLKLAARLSPPRKDAKKQISERAAYLFWLRRLCALWLKTAWQQQSPLHWEFSLFIFLCVS
jgi:hypothetical protein